MVTNPPGLNQLVGGARSAILLLVYSCWLLVLADPGRILAAAVRPFPASHWAQRAVRNRRTLMAVRVLALVFAASGFYYFVAAGAHYAGLSG